MKNNLLLLFLLMPAMMFGQTVGHIILNLSAGVSMTEVQSIVFSNIVMTGAGTVTILTDGSRTFTGDCVLKDEFAAPGKFHIVGSPNSNFKITFGDMPTITNGKYNLVVSDLKTSLPNNIGTLGSDGKLFVTVGCKVTIPNGVNSGLYQGVFTLVASYE